MSKLNKVRVAMPCQDPLVRITNYDEVALGYSHADALAEAGRCLQCKKPGCVAGCPVEVPIGRFIGALVADNLEEAHRIIKSTNSLPAICGRVCPQENQCEGKCILNAKGNPVAIGRLERYVADYFLGKPGAAGAGGTVCKPKDPEAKVACIGGGPASITVAGYLAARGVKVTVFEALHEIGGVLVYGIPEFRLPKAAVVQKELANLAACGVEFKTNWVGGKTVSIQNLFRNGYKAVFVGVGAGLPKFFEVPGENLNGVLSANEYLTRLNLGRGYDFPNYDTPAFTGRKVTVYGAGNVAMDAARSALRTGAEKVSIVYRRTKAEMPARKEEMEHAEEEGVVFEELAAPLEFVGDAAGQVKEVKLQVMRLGEPDASGRRSPEPEAGVVRTLETDLAVIALGTQANRVLLEATPELALNKRGYIEVGENNETSIPDVFAGGDIVTGAATVIKAMGAGRVAAKAIAERLGVAEI
ncbi:MAG: NADPH-dependent glutamate synthase [Deltaproteobacteria bacterium]|jgi:glutamate synthase (NADPH/NADH) small chain|nr:NADPH-dependent glutamate synthase [Deltaproteobacteria bacterium]